MARFILILLAYYFATYGLRTLSIGTSSTEVQSFEGEGVPLGTEAIDESGLGGNSQYGQLTALSAQGSMEAQSLSMPNNL